MCVIDSFFSNFHSLMIPLLQRIMALTHKRYFCYFVYTSHSVVMWMLLWGHHLDKRSMYNQAVTSNRGSQALGLKKKKISRH